MNSPTFADFSLQPTDLKRADRAKIALALLSCIIAVGVFYEIVSVKGLKGWIGNAQVLVSLVFLPPQGPLLVYFAAKALLRRIWPLFNRAELFASALHAYNRWWVRTQETFWNSLSGRRFEQELAALYQRLGVRADLTPATDDKGVDIWLTQDGQRIPVQCKAHSKPVGPSTIREFIGTMDHFGVSRGVLASLSGFSRGVHQYNLGRRIQLLLMGDIIEMQKKLR